MLAVIALTLAPIALPDTGWIAFEQTAIATARMGCAPGGKVSLDGNDQGWSIHTEHNPEQAMHTRFTVFIELDDRQPRRVKAFSPDCDVMDADRAERMTFKPAEVVAIFEPWLTEPLPQRLSSRMIAVLAHIDSPQADTALESAARNLDSKQVANDALFWLAQLRGDRGRRVVEKHLGEEWPLEHRQQAVVSLGLSKHPEALQTVREVARFADEQELRAGAVTALGIAKAPGVLADLHTLLMTDESDAVREQAIFWLSQMKESDAAGILADVARDPRYGKHRKTALFWLTQMRTRESDAFFDDLFENDL